MRIQSSAINLASTSSLYKSRTTNESLKTWVGNSRPNFETNDSNKPPMLKLKLDLLDLSKQGKALQTSSTTNSQAVDDENSLYLELSPEDKQKISALQMMIEALTGKKLKFQTIDKIKLNKPVEFSVMPTTTPNITINRAQQVQPQRQGWGLEYEYHDMTVEQQNMSFSADGIVKTEDGREIDFSMQLNMSREFISSTDISIRAGDAVMKDPLVINFSGTAPSLTDQKYSFDLDADGTSDQISFVDQGSGFLALDLNSDGLINNGLELFGPQNNDGFAELSKYDEDSNGWIDENDEIFNKLRIWTKDANGNDQLFALGQKGVGAIYLGNIGTAFEMKNNQNDLQGAIRNSGVFLNENGTTGLIQHIDLAL